MANPSLGAMHHGADAMRSAVRERIWFANYRL
jgi:hypothetical protein